MLRTENLCFSYKPCLQPALQNLNINFKPGFNVVLGPNGAGNTTLLKSIFGLLLCKGKIWFQDKDITRMNIDDRTKLMSYLPQMDIATSSLTVFEMVLLGRLPDLGHKVKDSDIYSVERTLKTLNISNLAARSFSELSGGQKKIVFIAQTLVRGPRILLLDEPVNSLDLQKQLELCYLLRDIISKENISVVAVLHDINLAARFAHHIVVLDSNGSLFGLGTPREMITVEMLKDVYGVVVSVSYDEGETPSISAKRSVRNI